MAGGFLYRREGDRIQDEDFAPYLSIPLYVGGGAALGGLLGYVIGSFGDPPIAGASRGAAQAEPAHCASVTARVRGGSWTSGDLEAIGKCPVSGPPAIASELDSRMPEDSGRRAALVRASAGFVDGRIFSAGSRLARHPSAQDRIDGARVVALQLWEGHEIDRRWLAAALPGQVPPRATHVRTPIRGATPLAPEAPAEASQLFYEISRASDSSARRVGLVLRGAAAERWPSAVVLPANVQVTFDVHCGNPSLVVIQIDLDITLDFDVVVGSDKRVVQLGGLSVADVAAGHFDALRANRTPPTATLRLPLGDVLVSRHGTELARFGGVERVSRRRQKCGS
jgi:hypothetical protein